MAPVVREKFQWKELFDEVVTSGLCTGCAGCVIACPHDVLGYDDTNGVYKPLHLEEELGQSDCIHGQKGCTSCTRACPRFRDWEPQADTHLFGRAREEHEVSGIAKDVLLCRASDATVHEQGQDGGLVSAILIWALEKGEIDAALVSYLEGDGTSWKAIPGVARTRDEVLSSAGSRYTYSANTMAYGDAVASGAEKIALVGMSCMSSVPPIMAARKAGKVARRLSLNIGLLCSKTFDDAIFEELFEAKYGLRKQDMVKMNIKGVFQIWMRDGSYHEVPLKECHAWTRDGCKLCPDFAAEHADISTGGIGAFNDWTLTVVRTDRGARDHGPAGGRRGDRDPPGRRRPRRHRPHAQAVAGQPQAVARGGGRGSSADAAAAPEAARPSLSARSVATMTTPYDEVRYPTFSHAQLHPDRLAIPALLFGLDPAPADSCRYLELGCGDGGTLCALAVALPGSELVGVDLATTALQRGRGVCEQVGIGNLNLVEADVADLPDLGQFDYVVCHGVLSWVPEAARQGILRACRQQLRPQGVAYVSYNANPSGLLREMTRQMLRFHLRRGVRTPEEKLQEAHAFLGFLTTARNEGDPWRELLKSEIDHLERRLPSSLVHDELAEVNTPFWLYEVLEMAAEHGLRFLSEADDLGVQDALWPEHVVSLLKALEDEPEDREQYLDFLLARRFRQTLLCHGERLLDRPVPPGRLQGLDVAASARVVGAEEPDLTPGVHVDFAAAPGLVAGTDLALGKAALHLLGQRWPAAVPFPELLAAARRRPSGGGAAATRRTARSWPSSSCACRAPGWSSCGATGRRGPAGSSRWPSARLAARWPGSRPGSAAAWPTSAPRPSTSTR